METSIHCIPKYFSMHITKEPNICFAVHLAKYMKWNVQIYMPSWWIYCLISLIDTLIFEVVCYQSITQRILDDSFYFMLWCHSLASSKSFIQSATHAAWSWWAVRDGQGDLQYSDVVTTKWDSARGVRAAKQRLRNLNKQTAVRVGNLKKCKYSFFSPLPPRLLEILEGKNMTILLYPGWGL